MQTITMILILLVAVIASGFLTRLLPFKLPLPLMQIAVGAVLSAGIGFKITLDPEIFFLLFIPPLLFIDGWRIPKDAFFHDLRPILALAIGLVVFTVIGMGLFVEWLIPTVPLAVAFALAAILSPTDPVAVSAITSGTPIPARLMHILEGEALLNDASSLVCFRFAVLAALTGSFSLATASWQFVLVAGGGIVVGGAISWGVNWVNKWLVRMAGEDPGIQILVSLLVPFIAYIAAEYLNFSGILAAVAAGITMHHADLTGGRLASTRMQRIAVWDTVQLTLNGAIFVLLGEQLPTILMAAPKVAERNHIADPWYLLLYIVLIGIALTVLRFIWVWASLRISMIGAPRQTAESKRFFKRRLLVMTCSGVRGAITLAGILTLPIMMRDGSPFPSRDLMILLAMGVILLSLISGSILLPLLTRGVDWKVEKPLVRKEAKARSATAKAAIAHMEKLRNASPDTPLGSEYEAEIALESMVRLTDMYRRRIDDGDAEDQAIDRTRIAVEVERKVRIAALGAEREELDRLRMSGQINDTLHRRLMRELDLIETALVRQ